MTTLRDQLAAAIRLRNLDREVGQLPDCTCQHTVTAPTSATPRS